MTQLLFPEIFATEQASFRKRTVSRDEMNLAEFPLAVLSTRVDPSIKTLEFSDTLLNKNGETIERKWIITGADKFGLPTSSDDEVLLGLVKLTVDDGFRTRKVFFSRYELLRILRWTTEGRSYTRLQRALDRLSGVRIKATNAFYDNEAKSHSTRNFGIVDAYEINDGRSAEAKPSFFEWSEAMFKSFQVGFIKKLDLDFYLNLSSAISKRLYRFLDKHFWYRSRLTMNLFVLAHEKVGISRNYQYASSLRQQLDPALDELRGQGFIEEYAYSGKGRATEITVVSASMKPRVLGTVRNSAGRSSTGKAGAGKSGTQNSELDLQEAATNTREDAHEVSSTAGALASPMSVAVECPNDERGSASVPHVDGEGQGRNVRVTDGGVLLSRDESSARQTVSPVTDAESRHMVDSENPPSLSLEEMLILRGLHAPQARRLVERRSFGEQQRMRNIIAHFDKLVASRSRLVSRSPAGFLYRAMERPDAFMLPGEGGGSLTTSRDRLRTTSHGSASQSVSSYSDSSCSVSSPRARREGARPHRGAFREASAAGGADPGTGGLDNHPGRKPYNHAAAPRDQLAELQATYLETRKRAMQQVRLDVEPEMLSKIRAEVEAALEKLKKLISPIRFSEAVEHGIEERLAKLFAYPDFDEWLQQQRISSLRRMS